MSRAFVLWFFTLCVAAGFAAVVAVMMTIDVRHAYQYDEIRAGSVIKISHEKGHGSAVHIGDRYALTAAHVLPAGAKTITALFDDDISHEAEVLWRNDAYDVALLRLPEDISIAHSRLSCRVPKPDEMVIANGNPLGLQWIKTRGYIAGGAIDVGRWKSVVTLSIPIAGGMSGGALFDARGDLVGILVGAPLQPVGMGVSFVGLAFAVPGKTVCDLMARV